MLEISRNVSNTTIFWMIQFSFYIFYSWIFKFLNLVISTKKISFSRKNHFRFRFFPQRYQESALSYVRMTNEAKDLRSALLLEQASYCYLLCNPPLVRKYSFHVILSGYRFSKSGQKKHSSRTYRQGFQVCRIDHMYIHFFVK